LNRGVVDLQSTA